ncbi:MAG: glycerophosphodiester phosphodiesterase family protein [Dehalococcoidia bacterium]
MAWPLVISHRTNMGTRPENSLEGIAAALEDGVDAIEVDVRASRDGVAMLLHDASLARTHGDAHALAALTAGEARALGVPTLADALAAVAGRATLCIELKERGLEVAVARDVRSASAAAWCWTWAFDPSVASACREVLPEAPAALNVSARSMVELDSTRLSPPPSRRNWPGSARSPPRHARARRGGTRGRTAGVRVDGRRRLGDPGCPRGGRCRWDLRELPAPDHGSHRGEARGLRDSSPRVTRRG